MCDQRDREMFGEVLIDCCTGYSGHVFLQNIVVQEPLFSILYQFGIERQRREVREEKTFRLRRQRSSLATNKAD